MTAIHWALLKSAFLGLTIKVTGWYFGVSVAPSGLLWMMLIPIVTWASSVDRRLPK